MSQDKPDNADRDILKGGMSEFYRLYLADREYDGKEKAEVVSVVVSEIASRTAPEVTS